MKETESFTSAILDANIEVLSLPPRTRDSVRESTANAEIIALTDGTPALMRAGAVLGAAPDVEVVRRVFGEITGKQTLVVIFGLGLGHAAREVRARTAGNVLVYEPDAGILRAVLENGPTDLGGIFITTDARELEAMWPALTSTPTATLFVTPGYAEAFPAELTALGDSMRMLVCDTEIIENTRAKRFAEWVRHLAENIHVAGRTSPITALCGELTGVPAFIVGAGPSLDKNIEELRRAKKKGIVLAVDVAGGALDRHGMAPHVLVSLEALNLSRELAKLTFMNEVIFSASLTAHPAAHEVPAAHTLPFFEAMAAFSSVQELLNVPGVIVGGSVSTVAFSLAHAFGCSPIVLVGQDLAYSGSATHASGTPFDGCTVELNGSGSAAFAYNETISRVRAESSLGAAPKKDPVFPVKSWGGGEATVMSTASFNAFRLWFEVWATAMAGKVELVNATEGGSHIEGFREESLSAVVNALPDRDISTADLAARAAAKRPPLGRAAVSRYLDAQASRALAVEKSANVLVRAASRAERAIKREEPGAVVRAFEDLARAESGVREASREVPMLSGFLYAETSKMDAAASASAGRDMRADAAWSVKASMELARAIARGARALENVLRHGKQTMKRTTIRNEETV